MLEPWLPFLGRLHPLTVHLPIGFVFVLFILLLVSPRGRRPGFRSAERVVLWGLLLVTLAAAGFGLVLAEQGSYGAELLNTHRNLGIAMAIGVVVTLMLHYGHRRWGYVLALGVTLGLTAGVGHFGGSITHGRGYLASALPAEWQEHLAFVAGATEVHADADRPRDPQSAELYADVVQAFFDNRCVSCHGAEKAEGELRLDSFEATMAGGETGPSVEPGAPQHSEMVRRLNLPLGHDERMPPEGRSQPTSAEIAMIQWWITLGAPEDGSVVEYQDRAPEQVAEYLDEQFDEPADEAVPEAEPVPDDLYARASALSDELGIIIHPLADGEPDMRVNAGYAGEAFGDEELARLEPIFSYVRELELNDSEVSDRGLEYVREMHRLERLSLTRTQVTDEGLSHLVSLPRLSYLNLYGTDVTNEGLDVLAQFPALDRVYLWQTEVTPEAAEAFAERMLERARPQIEEMEAEIAELERRLTRQGVQVQLGTELDPDNVQVAEIEGEEVSLEEAEALEAPEPAEEEALADAGSDSDDTGDDEETSAEGAGQDDEQLALNSACPVSGEPTSAAHIIEYQGQTLAFCCGDCQARFEANPSEFVEDEGSENEVALNTTCPVSGEPASAAHTVEHNGRTVAFCCGNCQARFEADPSEFVAQLDSD